MTKKTELVIESECNVKFNGLDAITRKKIVEETTYFLHYARYTPAYKLGRWDGKISYSTIGGRTYFSLLDRVLPIVLENGYDVDIVDKRKKYSFSFPKVTNSYLIDNLKSPVWPSGHKNEGEPIMLMDHQVNMINNYLENLHSIYEISTGSGKCIGYNTKIDIKINNKDFENYLTKEKGD